MTVAEVRFRPLTTDFLAAHLAEVPYFRALIRATECRLIARLGALPAPVLDVGCGDGHFAQMVFADQVDVGIDPLPAAVAEARQRRVYRSVMVGSTTCLPFSDGAFRGVISNCVLEHVPDLGSALAEIGRVLAREGIFVATVPSAHHPRMLFGARLPARLGLRPLAAGYARWFTRVSQHYHLYDVAEWERLFRVAGLALLEHRYYFSTRTLAVFELGHFLSAPSLVTRRLAGRWVLWPSRRKSETLAALLRRFYAEPEPTVGAYLCLVARHA